MNTRTGNYPIGFRRRSGEWEQDLGSMIAWTQQNNLSVIDLGKDGDKTAQQVIDAGLRVGSVDLTEAKGMLSPDKGKRAAAVARNSEYVRACAAVGPMNHFLAMIPEDPALPRAENFGYMAESFAALAPVLEESNARIVIEGWPGPGALCCTPETYRAFFQAVPSPAMGVNYDPSHLMRMGIDPLRFLHEFIERVYHVHGKDTELLSENLYEYGTEQPATFAKPIWFGAQHWRYTIPGQGQVRWTTTFEILEQAGYSGCVSIELEDANFNGATDTEQLGILKGAEFLAGC